MSRDRLTAMEFVAGGAVLLVGLIAVVGGLIHDRRHRPERASGISEAEWNKAIK